MHFEGKQPPAWLVSKATATVFDTIRENGFVARFVGGCVRDALLGLDVTDLDVATTMPANAMLQAFKERGIRVVPTGIEHGTVTVVIGGQPYQITTLRKDMACDGRHADVAFTDSWEEDAARRDFTMNAMFLDLEGRIYDFHGGLADLTARKIRFIGNPADRIREDYLRILRFFRFFARFAEGKPDAEGFHACASAAPHIAELSGERIQQEMLKLIQAPRAVDAVAAMHEAGVLPYVQLEGAQLPVLEALLTLGAVHRFTIPSLLRLAALVPHWTVEGGEALAQRWKLSRIDETQLEISIANSAAVLHAEPLADRKRIIRLLGNRAYQDALLLAWARDIAEDKRSAEDRMLTERLHFASRWFAPHFPLKGKDLLAQGFREGREIGQVLAELERLWEQSDYSLSREELLGHSGHYLAHRADTLS